jgi:hypothetical protein
MTKTKTKTKSRISGATGSHISLQHKSLPSEHLSQMRRSCTPKTRPNIAVTTAKSHKSGALEADAESAISKSARSLSSEQLLQMHRQKHRDFIASISSLSSSAVTPDSANSNFDDISSLQNTAHEDKNEWQRLQLHNENCELVLKLNRAMDTEQQYRHLADCLSKNMRRTLKENDELTQGIHNLIQTCDTLEKEQYLLEKETEQKQRAIQTLEDTLEDSEHRMNELMEHKQAQHKPPQQQMVIANCVDASDANELKAAKKEATTLQKEMLVLDNEHEVLLEDCEKLLYALRTTRQQRDDLQKEIQGLRSQHEDTNDRKTATPSSKQTFKKCQQEKINHYKNDDPLHQSLLSFADDSHSGKGSSSSDGLGGHRFHNPQSRASSSEGGSEDIDVEEAKMSMSALSFDAGDESTLPKIDEYKNKHALIAEIIKGGAAETIKDNNNSNLNIHDLASASCLPSQSTNDEASMLELKEQLTQCHVEISCLAHLLQKERTMALSASRQSKQSERKGRSRSSKASFCDKARSMSPCVRMRRRNQHQHEIQERHRQVKLPPSGRRGRTRTRSPYQRSREATETRLFGETDALYPNFRDGTAARHPALTATTKKSSSRSCYGVND